LSSTFTAFISLLKDFGYTTYIVQQEQINERELVAINTRVVLLGILSFFAVCVLVIPLSKIYNTVELNWILPITGLQFILNSFTLVPFALLLRNMEFNKTGKIDVGANLTSVCVGVISLVFIRSYWVLLLTSMSYVLFQLLFTLKLSSWTHKFSNPFTNKISKSGSMYGIQLTVFNVMTFVSVTLDNIIIGKLAGVAVLGNYSKSMEFGNSNIDRLVRKPIHQVYFSDLSGKNLDEKCKLYFQYLFLLVTLITLIIGPALLFNEKLVNKFLSAKWQPLIGMLPPFLVCTIFWMTMSLADQLLISTSKLKRYLFLGFLKAVTGSCAIIVASSWGPKAIAYSFLIYHVLLFVPFCSSIFSGIDVGNAKANAMLRDTCIIVISALLTVLIPFLLFYWNFIGIDFALIIFILSYIILHTSIWPRIIHYQSFKLFFKSLISFKVSNV
jgi:O-antigen/teichoic acid export membrane protein